MIINKRRGALPLHFHLKAAALAGVVAFGALGAALSGCSALTAANAEDSAQAAAAPLTAVEALTVERGEIKKEIVYAGKLAPNATLSVVSKLSGKITDVYADVGDRVRAGDILLKLDEQDIQSQLDQIDAQIHQADQGVVTAENALNSVTGGQYQAQVLQQETSLENYDKQLENAQIALDNAALAIANAGRTLENAQRDYDNAKSLYESGAVAENDLTKAEFAKNQAQAAYEQAQNALAQAQVGYDQLVFAKDKAAESLALTRGRIVSDSTRQASLAVEQAKASRDVLYVQRETITKNLSETQLESPISGVVNICNARAGEFVSPQAPAFVLVDLDRVNVEVSVSELLINKIRTGDQIDVIIHALGGAAYKGEIVTISPSADQTSLFPVKIAIDNPDGILRSGMFAEVRFIKEHSEGAVVLPRGCVLSNSAGDYVYVVRDGLAYKAPVTTGVDNGKEVEITEGLTFGEQVVVKGGTNLSDGEAVNVVAGPDAAASGVGA
ncbi:MAG: efflux RND transporter periplasmic adaptor subunit [Clostridiales bacterium]|jgi:RND family efflux transporter MFP subunit|nr:efflux RND transporter periplasmic adaptor subunit [Clostridiales bacterium]